MSGIADHGAYCGALPLFLALPSPGTVTLLHPKAIVSNMAFFPLFIDPADDHGAGPIAAFVQANRRLARKLERRTGVFLPGFGVRQGAA